MPNPPDNCPVCGADVPPRSRACPECGADDKTGWSEKARCDELGIPDDSFDYDKFVAEEFGGKQPRRKHQWLWFAAAILVLSAFVFALVRR